MEDDDEVPKEKLAVRYDSCEHMYYCILSIAVTTDLVEDDFGII
jgi:hypothetical protein